jgi:hypothetical protein
MLWEGEHGEVIYWSCTHHDVVSAKEAASAGQRVYARRKSPGEQRLALDPSEKTTLCYQDLDRSAIAQAIGEVTGRTIVVSETDDAGARTLCLTGTVDELLKASGLALQD